MKLEEKVLIKTLIHNQKAYYAKFTNWEVIIVCNIERLASSEQLKE